MGDGLQISLADLSSLAELPRTALLSTLKDRGVCRLPDRQRVANELARTRRNGSLDTLQQSTASREMALHLLSLESDAVTLATSMKLEGMGLQEDCAAGRAAHELLQNHRRMRHMALAMGTHPRLGARSPLLALAGCGDILRRIAEEGDVALHVPVAPISGSAGGRPGQRPYLRVHCLALQGGGCGVGLLISELVPLLDAARDEAHSSRLWRAPGERLMTTARSPAAVDVSALPSVLQAASGCWLKRNDSVALAQQVAAGLGANAAAGWWPAEELEALSVANARTGGWWSSG